MSLYVDIRKKLGGFTLETQFEAADGVTGILGASGCGKSMTLRCIAGIVKPDEGHIELDGKVLFDARKKINLRPQERNPPASAYRLPSGRKSLHPACLPQ